jgi:release factor glutamine methyltransferase
MSIGEWIRSATTSLTNAGIETARLDVLVILEDLLKKDRAWLLAHQEQIIQGSDLEKLNTIVVQRSSHMPLAYIRSKAEFYGREFIVSTDTLVPRPETEGIIDILKTFKNTENMRLLDVGTGSGCIAITLALELPFIHVSACDIDSSCIEITKKNMDHLHASIKVYEDDLIAHAEPCDIIVANLPYVPTNVQINRAAAYEPSHAIFGGIDGLEPFRELFKQLRAKAWRPKYIITESLPSSHNSLVDIAKAAGYQVLITDDFAQCFSVV